MDWRDWLVSEAPWSVNDVLLAGIWITGIAAAFGCWIYATGREWLELREERRRRR